MAVSGCATLPPPKPALHPFVVAHRITIGSQGYLPASAVIEHSQGQARWDPEALVWTLILGAHTLKLSPGMPVALIDGRAESMPAAPIQKEGELLLPELLWTRWISSWVVPRAPVAPPVPRAIRTVILDPGHGGHDPGAIGRSGLKEKTVTLDIALRLRDLLEERGFRVIMTRKDDRFVSLSRRSDLANWIGGDLFVSIHANASRHRAIRGFEVYTLSEATDDHARALEAAENASLPIEGAYASSPQTEAIVWDLLYTEYRAGSMELASSISRGLARSRLGLKDRGIKSARFAVLKGARMPAILVEVGFLTHPGEESRLKSASHRQAIAEGIRDGILAFQAGQERRDALAP